MWKFEKGKITSPNEIFLKSSRKKMTYKQLIIKIFKKLSNILTRH